MDVSFSGTTTLDILSGSRRRPAQVDSIHSTTRLVTITTGGNDVGFVGQLWAASAATRKPPLAWRPFCRAPSPSQVQDAFDDLPARLDAIVHQVRARSPKALIVLVDYATVLPPTDETSDRLPIDKHQLRHLRDIARRLEDIGRQAARRAGTELVHASQTTVDHHVNADHPWVEPWTFPTTPFHWGSLAYHPTLDGMRAIAGTSRCRWPPTAYPLSPT
jgi:lysophospholipase L1-like esterase